MATAVFSEAEQTIVEQLFDLVGWDKPTHELASLFISVSILSAERNQTSETSLNRAEVNEVLSGYVSRLQDFQQQLEKDGNRHGQIIAAGRQLLKALEPICEGRSAAVAREEE